MTRGYDDFITGEGTGKGWIGWEGYDERGLCELWEPADGLGGWQGQKASGGYCESRGRGRRKETGDRGLGGRCSVVDDLLARFSGKGFVGRERLEAYLRHKHRQNVRVSTLRNTVSIIGCFLGFLEDSGRVCVEALSRGDLEGFIEHEQDRGLKASTVHARMRMVKAFVRFLMDEGLVNEAVLSRRLTIKVPQGLPRAIPTEDLRRLLAVIVDARDRAMVMVLLRTGMRIGELLHTRLEHVIVQQRKILIFEAQKNRVGRAVYLSDDALEALHGWLDRRDAQRQFLFYAAGGKERMCYGTARKMLHRYLAKAGLAHKGYTLHSLRHTFATQLLNAGMRLECLQVLLGHGSLEMTRRYAKLTDKSREQQYFAAMEKILKEQSDEPDGVDRELEALFEEEELFGPHGQDVPQRP